MGLTQPRCGWVNYPLETQRSRSGNVGLEAATASRLRTVRFAHAGGTEIARPVEFRELRNSASTFVRALLRGGGDGAQTFYLLLESLTRYRARIHDTTIS